METVFKFDIFDDYKKQFKSYVDELLATESQYTLEERKQIIDQLTTSYVMTVDEKPDAKQLERLATWLLLEAYTNKKKNKKDEANPVLTTKQVMRRKQNERRLA